jgi:hypothetical protein
MNDKKVEKFPVYLKCFCRLYQVSVVNMCGFSLYCLGSRSLVTGGSRNCYRMGIKTTL